MAEIHATFQVIGGGSIQLPVTFLTSVPVTVVDVPVDVEFSVQNTLDRVVSFSSIQLTKSGPGEGKITVSLLNDAMTLQPMESVTNKVTIEPNETLVEGDSPTISIDAVGG